MSSYNKLNTIERLEKNFPENNNQSERINTLIDENSKLSVLLELYNRILQEYQLKYGNELYEEVAKNNQISLQNHKIDNNTQNIISNFSLLKEYETELLKRDKTINSLNEELSSLNEEIQNLIKTNKEIREELVKTQEENSALLNNMLRSNNNNEKVNEYEKEKTQLNNFLTTQKDELLNNIENYKTEYEKIKYVNQELSIINNNLESENKALHQEYSILKNEHEDIINLKEAIAKKYRILNEEIIRLEKEVEVNKNMSKKYENNEIINSQEILFYKVNYADLENRKNQEIENMIKEISIIKEKNRELNDKIEALEEEKSSYRYELEKLKIEYSTIKDYNIQLNKMLESSNKVVKSIQLKENKINDIEKSYKRIIANLTIDKEKLDLKIKILEQNSKRNIGDYQKMSNEKQEKYENYIELISSKNNIIIEKKDEEIHSLKNDNIIIKLENDRLYNDYNLIKKEYDKLTNFYKEESEKTLNKLEESEKKSLKQNSILIEKNNILSNKIDAYEFKITQLENKIKLFDNSDKNKDLIIDKLNKVEDNKDKDYSKLKEKYELLLTEKEEIEKEYLRFKKLCESKYDNLRTQSELKLGLLEHSLNYQKSQMKLSEDKAYDLLKKQENVSNINLS